MNIPALENVAKSVRALSADAVEKAKSGHPGLPLGMADFGAWLFGERLAHNPANSAWPNRDRFVLSAGHGSMFLYSLLHLSGYKLSLEELRNFRQLNSLTPGHPEYGHTDGVETTTGPLGQGFANAVGLAIGQAFTAASFNTASHRIIDHYIYTLMGDGCMMEGVSNEAASMAGHLKLGRLIAFYDSNRITIEGGTELAFSEDVGARFEALGWQVLRADAYDYKAMDAALLEAQKDEGRPSLIILTSTIGKGAPNKAGSAEVHGAPLGSDEISAFRKEIGIPDEDFHVAPGVAEYFSEKRKLWAEQEAKWNNLFAEWAAANPELKKKWDSWMSPVTSAQLEDVELPLFETGKALATRSTSGAALQALSAAFSNLLGGSADLAPSNNTMIKAEKSFGPGQYGARNFHFGVREHAMGAVANGMALYGGLKVYNATFLVFSDYMRPAIRLASLMKLPVSYVFTHDSIFVGEDGPTHQPIEHVSALRSIPGLHVMRPADGQESNEAWKHAMLRHDGPVALCLTRQNLTVFEKAAGWEKDFRKGAYQVWESAAASAASAADLRIVVATGSEVNLALEAAMVLGEAGRPVRVVSMPCRELFYQADKSYREKLLPAGSTVFVAEAGISMGWEGIAGSRDRILCLDSFGLSGPGAKVAEAMGLSAARLRDMIEASFN